MSRMTGQEKLTYLDFCKVGAIWIFTPILPKSRNQVTTLEQRLWRR